MSKRSIKRTDYYEKEGMRTVLDAHIEKAGYEANESTIENITFSIKEGELVGLIGPNGAGKSTTIKSILGLVKEVDGVISISGYKESYAYIPEQPVYYEELTLWDHIEFTAQLCDYDLSEYKPKAEQLLREFHLLEVKHHFPSSFSKGMQQKLMLVLALLTEPDVYIVDEPFVGLDPKAIKTLLRLLDNEQKRGAGILMCTHVLDTAEKVCDRFLLLFQGEIVTRGTLFEIRDQCGQDQGSLMDCFEAIVE